MNRIPRKSLLGTFVSATDYHAASEFVLDAAQAGRSARVTALDAHGLAKSAREPAFQSLLNRFDLVTADGHSLRWGLNAIHGSSLKDRVAGPDLTLHICRKAAERGVPIYAYGSRQHVVEGFANALEGRFPGLRIAGLRASRFRPATPEEDEDDVRHIRDSGARLVLVGLGCPLQEQWVDEHADKLSVPCLAIGAAFDFHSGNKKRAPVWMQRAGMEWIFRMAVEPRRLVRRTCPAVAYVAVCLIAQKFRSFRHVQRVPPGDPE
jgi:N-acetylglucosaminyldiphosphoundecaprenol N-acetyl-beta-D-mannosaminyltransferase